MIRVCLILLLIFSSGCGRTSFYAPLGATVGGAVGSLGGPVGSGGGALVGWSVGKGAALVEENEDLVQTVDALSRGDVDALIAAQVNKQKGWVESTVDGLWTTLKWILGLIVLWQIVPLFLHKHIARNGNNKKESGVVLSANEKS